MTTTAPAAVTAEALGERLFAAALGTADMFAIYLGDRLGWYDALAKHGPSTPGELAERTSTSPRYAREWLEQQAVTGLLTIDDDGRFALPTAAAEVLTDRHSLMYLAPIARMFAAAARQLPALLEAYRSGGGVSWEELGADARESQADMNRPWYESALPGPWLACLASTRPSAARRPTSSTSGAAPAGRASRSLRPTRTCG